jgi:hypothetical protein
LRTVREQAAFADFRQPTIILPNILRQYRQHQIMILGYESQKENLMCDISQLFFVLA